MKAVFLLIAVISFGCGPATDANNFVRNTNAVTSPSPDQDLVNQLAEIAKESKGKVGVSAVLIETGENVGINRSDRFAMQSVVKLPISMAVLRQAELGKLTRDQMVAISKSEMVPSGMRSPIRDKSPDGGEMTVEQLIKFAISESDGTAADVLQRVAGGAAGVQDYINSMNLIGMEVKWSHLEFSKDFDLQYDNFSTPDAAVGLLRQVIKGSKERRQAEQSQDTSPAPGAQPNFIEYGVSKEHAELLLKFMTESNNPDGRIKGMLPQGTVVAHKTGTGATRDGVTAATNDVGIITLPNGNHIAIAVFVQDSSGDQKTREGTIARIAKAIFDKWNK